MVDAGPLLLLMLVKFTLAGALFMPLMSFGLFLARVSLFEWGEVER